MKYRLSCSTGPPLKTGITGFTSGTKSLRSYRSGLFKIKPIDPSSLCSASNIADRLNDKSPMIEGSAMSKSPLEGILCGLNDTT